MKRYLFFLSIIISFLFFSCKSLPVIEQGKPGFKQDINPFLDKKYQLTHSIKADLPNGDKLLVIGVTIVDPAERSIHAILMTVEGLVLFDVNYNNNAVTINRGMPGMQNTDSSDFIRALIDDLKLIYFMPESEHPEAGTIDGKFIKRYTSRDNMVIDIILNNDKTVKINKYDGGSNLVRTVNIFSINSEGLPEKLELTAPGLFGYSLYMELVNAEKL
jgi:hypothetical protein